jgi:hypothetical protein
MPRVIHFEIALKGPDPEGIPFGMMQSGENAK